MTIFTPVIDRKIRFALDGAARVSINHMGAIAQHAERCDLVDVCDIDLKALKVVVQKTGGTGHASLAIMLGKTNADAVILATPSNLHRCQAIEVAAAGRHVVSQKPMATRSQDGLAMVRACDAAGVQLFVVKQNRRNATLQLLKKTIGQGRFGYINNVAVNVFWTRLQEYYDAAKWCGTWEWDGGAFMNQASHYIYLLSWLIGPV